jgi:hypothetical protein
MNTNDMRGKPNDLLIKHGEYVPNHTSNVDARSFNLLAPYLSLQLLGQARLH